MRVNLLERYGGLWLDSTILLTEPLDNHKDWLDMPCFTQKFFNGQANYNIYSNCASYGRWASFAQGSNIVHNPLFAFGKDLFNQYWLDFDEQIDYLLIDFKMNLAYEGIPFVKQEIDAVPVNNLNVWTLLGILQNPYKNFPYDKIWTDNFIWKLTYKYNWDYEKEGTILKEIQRRYAPETL